MADHVQIVEIEGAFTWQFFKDTGCNRWIAVCDPLRLTIEADSSEELRENIADGLNLLFTDLLRDNALDAYLQSHGWKYANERPQGNDVKFDVPFELIAKRNHDCARAIH